MESSLKIKQKIGFIGCGNMAKAIISGIIHKGLVVPSQIYAAGPHLENLESLKAQGILVSDKNAEVVEESDVIFICVKPHVLAEAISNIYQTLSHDNKIVNKLFVSVLAGTTLEALENSLIFEGSRVIRAMPNTPMMVGEGCTAYCPGANATESDIAIVQSILSVLGICRLVPESMINAIGALAGSGPAYIYLVIEAMSDAGVKMGIPREMATTFAAQTVLGAGKMVLETGKHTGQLRDEVCSPGGTTITGIHALEKNGVRAAFIDAIEAATKKSLELSQHGNNHKKKC